MSLAPVFHSSSTAMSSDLLTLNCLVLGNSPPSDFVFVVNIQGNRTVDDLRATIKAECQNVLDFDEDLLAIWSASIVMDDNFNTKLADFQPSFYNGCRKWKIGTELADIFIGGPGREHLNIIVQPPDDGEIRVSHISHLFLTSFSFLWHREESSQTTSFAVGSSRTIW